MKSMPKVIRQFVGILLFSSGLLFAANFILLGVIAVRQAFKAPNAHPWKVAEEAVRNMV